MRGWGIGRERIGLPGEGARNPEKERVDASEGCWRGGGGIPETQREDRDTESREQRPREGRTRDHGPGRGDRDGGRDGLAGSEVRVFVRSATVQGCPGALGPRVGGCK